MERLKVKRRERVGLMRRKKEGQPRKQVQPSLRADSTVRSTVMQKMAQPTVKQKKA